MAKTKEIYNTEIKEDDTSSDKIPKKNQVPSGLVSTIFFILVTTIFTIIVYVTLPNMIPDSNTGTNILYVIIYILILVVGNYFINLNLTKSICGGQPQWANTMIFTLIPWILIFGVINLVLIVFPGWITPFANTFGYLFMKLLGVEDLLKNILNLEKDDPGAKLTPQNKLVARGIQEIYGNSSLFLNQIPSNPVKFREFVTTLANTGYFRQGINIGSSLIIDLYKFIQLKEIIGKYIWNLLSGILVTSVSFNYILNTECTNSLKTMQKNRNEFLMDEKERQTGKQKNRVYYPFLVGNENDENVKSSTYAKTDN